MIRYRLRQFGRLVAELDIDADTEIHLEPDDVEALKWGEHDAACQ